MPKNDTENKQTGLSRSFYLEADVSAKIDAWAEKKERSASWIVNKLLKQALVCPKWNWCGKQDEE